MQSGHPLRAEKRRISFLSNGNALLMCCITNKSDGGFHFLIALFDSGSRTVT